MSEIYNDYDPNKMTFSPFEPNIEFQYLKITSKEGGLVNVRIPPDKNPLLIDYKGFGRFEIENIDLEWKEISSECNNLDYCEYCPHTTRNSNGEILNDKGFPINPGYLNSDLCQKFEATVLFKFDLATVLVKDCSFHDIRVGIKNLFYIDSC